MSICVYLTSRETDSWADGRTEVEICWFASQMATAARSKAGSGLEQGSSSGSHRWMERVESLILWTDLLGALGR